MLFFFLAYFLQNEVTATINVLDKGVAPLVKDSVGIQFFIDVENENRKGSCLVHTWVKKCCMTDSEKEDCNIIHVYTADAEIKPRDRETLIYVYPTLFQHDQMGYCDFVLNYQCGETQRKGRELINIPLDTRVLFDKHVPAVLSNYVAGRKRADCSFVDEDALNNCAPVNCDEKYSSGRPIFNPTLSKCVAAVRCVGNPHKELPDVVLVPNSNVCRDLDTPLTVEDILAISRGLLITTLPPKQENEMMVEFNSNCSTISQNLFFLRDMMLGKFCPALNIDTTQFSKCYKEALIKIGMCIVAVGVMILFMVFCLNCIAWATNRYRDGSFHERWKCLKCKFKRSKQQNPYCSYKVSRVDADVRNSLLRQVIVRDIPIELRDSVVDICDRMDQEVKWKRRYRREDIGSQVSLGGGDASSDTSDSEDNDRSRLLKQ